MSSDPSKNVSRPTPMPLPPIEDCLFGISQKCPKIYQQESKTEKGDGGGLGAFLERGGESADDSDEYDDEKNEDDDDKDDTEKQADTSVDLMYDTFQTGHWGEAAKNHDINMDQLRKICNHGIADEGSHRGVTWRVLLHFLGTKDIAKNWPDKVPPQREFYQQLVEEYFVGSMDRGKDLRGHHSKKLRDRRLRKQYNRMQRLDASADDLNHSEDEGDDDDESIISEMTDVKTSQKKSKAAALTKVHDLLPDKFKEEWIGSGINLDKTSVTKNVCTAMVYGSNFLKVPKLDETMQDEFHDFMEDIRLLEEIRKDALRTHPELYFFLEPNDDLGMRRYGALERILFVWAKLNRGVRYVQGMNEIVGTIYYVLANDHNSEWANHAEADTYFLFHSLMIDMRDVFVPDMDLHTTGIQGRIEQLQRLVKTHDPEVYQHLEDCGIDASFYAFRWITTMLSREFLLPDTIRLWDSMLASTHKENFLRYVCATMVIMVREDLLKGDFSTCLRLLQKYPIANIDTILESSRALWVYESQITLKCNKGGISLHQALQSTPPPEYIIMAFGFKGGIAPNFHDRLESARNQAQEKVQTAKEGLMDRAHKFWSGWGANNVSTETNEKASSPASAPIESKPSTDSQTAPASSSRVSRFWRRRNSSANESVESDPPKTPATTALPVENKVSSAPPLGSSSTNNGSATTTRRLIWNRSPVSQISKEKTDVETPAVDLPNLKPATNNPTTSRVASKFRIWNRGPPSRNNSRAEEATSDAAVPVN